jgi:glycine cleavage system transcriptional repressor
MMDEEISMVISVMDCDRPGIVAEVTEGISALGGNLADLRESVLCGYFTMILVASFPANVTPDKVCAALAQATSAEISVKLYEGGFEHSNVDDQTYILSAVGRDRVGLVALVSRFCCDRGINILDLASHVEGDFYTMMLQLDFSEVTDMAPFEKELAEFGQQNGLNLVLQHNDIFKATNEI